MYLCLWSWLMRAPGLKRDCMNRSRKAGTRICKATRRAWAPFHAGPSAGRGRAGPSQQEAALTDQEGAREEGSPPSRTPTDWQRVRKATHELHGRRVHAREHLEQDGDVGRVQGPFGQHGPQGLASPGVGGRCAQGQRDLTGVVASGREEHTAVTPQAGPVPTSLPRLRLCVAGAPGLSRGSVSPGTLTTACAVTTTLHTRLADLEGGRHVPSTSGPRQQNTKQPGLRLFCGIRTTTPGTTERRPQDHRRLSPANPNVLGTRVRKQ